MPKNLVATYRLQLHARFGFADAAGIAGYIAELGVSHVYCSPYLQAAPGSTHGYDVVDPSRVNEELGGEMGHRDFVDELERRGLGQVLDIVPNHMAIAPGNTWWWDVLENGPASAYAEHFDVNWTFPVTRRPNRLLMPILAERYGEAVESGEIQIERRDERLSVRYKDHALPLRPESISAILREAAEARPVPGLMAVSERFSKALSAADGRERLRSLLRAHPEVGASIDEHIGALNVRPDALDALLEAQFYRLAYWPTSGSELDYRRFFDINTLVGLRTSRESVFEDTHERVVEWLERGILDGVRVDHPDGLRDPEAYVKRLREASPDAWIVVEKILEPGERLPDSWPVQGTTGYDFMNRLNGIFVDPEGEKPLTDLYVELTGQAPEFEEWRREKKRLALAGSLASDVKRLAALLSRIAQSHRRSRDFTVDELEHGLRELAASFSVYRSYVRPESGRVSEQDQRVIEEAVEKARTGSPEPDPHVLDLLRDLLLLRIPGERESELVLRFQQLTGPAMAKGVEDTAFYGYNRFVSLNEVGGDPGRFGISMDAFHRSCQEAAEKWPLAMISTATHDTKRGEDVRARLNLLSEIPDRWAESVRRWMEHNGQHRRSGKPDRNAEYLFYQTLVGAWPLEVERAVAYMEKAAREAKMHTSWTRIDAAYEEALLGFVRSVLADTELEADLRAFVEPLVAPGRVNSLAQTLVKLTAPGVPDIYRGTELWDSSLVDPDNRRPVDYDVRRKLLAEIAELHPEGVLERADSGAPKLWLIRRTLALRRRRPQAFGPGSSYEPIAAEGEKAEHAIAFVRGGEVLALAPRLVLGLGDDWGETSLDLPDGSWTDALTDAVHEDRARIADLLARFPVALLSRS